MFFQANAVIMSFLVYRYLLSVGRVNIILFYFISLFQWNIRYISPYSLELSLEYLFKVIGHVARQLE